MPKPITFLAAGVVIVVSAYLLIAQRIDATPSNAFVDVRGEGSTESCLSTDTMRVHFVTCEAQWREVAVRWEKGYGGANIMLDENTDVSILDEHQGEEAISLVTGRIVIEAMSDVDVSIRDVTMTVRGTATLVHYSWLNKIDVMVIDGTADIRQGEFSSTITTGNSVSVDTLPPYDELSPTTFDLTASSAAAFYEWALQ